MPELPAIPVSQAQYDYLIEHLFPNVASWRTWVAKGLKSDIMQEEMRKAREDARLYVEQRRAEVTDLLGGM